MACRNWPFGYMDGNVILRKKKLILNQLLARDNINYLEKRIAILSGSTTSMIQSVLEIFLLHEGIRPKFYNSGYNRYYEDAVFGNTALDDFNPEIIIILTSMVNINEKPVLFENKDAIEKKLTSEFSRFKTIWESLNQRYNAIIIQSNMDVPWALGLGNLETSVKYSFTNFIERMNSLMAEYSLNNKGIYLLDLHGLSSKIGAIHWHDRLQYCSYKFPFSYDTVPDVALSLSNIIKSVLGKSKKCLVLDLDNTLWGGVIGDVGVAGISIGHETPEGEAYTDFQRYVKMLKARGIILAVCSKNDYKVATQGFTHPDSVLHLNDFASFHANWNPKDINIKLIAEEINIGTDSLVFIDDNPSERQLIRDTMPEVAVPEVDSSNVYSYITAIEDMGYFESVCISEDDLIRNESYIAEKKRTILVNSTESYDHFLQTLSMEAEIGNFKDVYYDRIVQLTNKTNQFNLTTKRFTINDIVMMTHDNNYITLYGRLKDKFGDNGLVSVMIGKIKEETAYIVLWLMSCRVFRRDFEHCMFDVFVEKAASRQCKKIIGYYYPTEKNSIVSGLYADLKFIRIDNTNEGSTWELKINDYKKKNTFIKIKKV